MAEFNISDTQISAKMDDIMYVLFESANSVREIHRRVAQIQDPQIKIRDFIPRHYFDRYTTIARLASDMRKRRRKK